MAKQTSLELVNRVLSNLGELSSLSVLTSLSGISLLVFHSINEALQEIAQEEGGHWKPLEAYGTSTLVTGTATYTRPTGVNDFHRKSFRYDGTAALEFYTADRWDHERLNPADTGQPNKVVDWGGVLRVHPTPAVTHNGKLLTWRHWVIPSALSTATATGTSWIPDGFDLTLLSNLVTYKVLHYKHNEEAGVYYERVFGNARVGRQGDLEKFRALWRSPEITGGDGLMTAII